MKSWLYTLLLASVAVGSSCLAFDVIAGPFVCALVFISALYIRLDKSRWSLVVRVTVAVVWLLLVTFLLLPAVSTCYDAGARMHCSGQMQRICLALRAYQSHYGTLPPACTWDPSGRPMHSWRVLILPFLECETLYSQYNLNEPWDSPSNRKVLAHRPDVFSCLADRVYYAQDDATTSYVAVVRRSDASPHGELAQLDDKKSADSTIVLLESANTHIPWTQPRDLCPDDLADVAKDAPLLIRSPHMSDNGYLFLPSPGGFYVVLSNGCSQFVPANSPRPAELASLLDERAFNEDHLRRLASNHASLRVNWPHAIGLPLWLVSTCLLLHLAVRARRTA
jgi:hypothetical protein